MYKFTSRKIHNIPNRNHNKRIESLNPRILWGIEFRLPIMNSAGMFKNGEGYDIVANQRAGGYIGGTSTYNSRVGNTKNGIKHPFLSLTPAHTTLNYLGLPNLGDEILSKKLITNNKIAGCPIGWSVMRSPDYPPHIGIENLVKSLWLYHDNLVIDFIEINESCPNVVNHNTNTTNNTTNNKFISNYEQEYIDYNDVKARLVYIAKEFLCKRKRKLPVVVKFSTDLAINDLPEILEILLNNQYDGINLGNTSTNYLEIRSHLDVRTQKLFDYFTKNFGGGVGGQLLKQKSLLLCANAMELLQKLKPQHEFHVIRTGGIDSLADIVASNDVGVSLNQWYSGYFTNYIKYGDELYNELNKKG